LETFFFLGKLTRFELSTRQWRDASHVWEAPCGGGWVAVDGWTEVVSKWMASVVGAGWWLLLTVVVDSRGCLSTVVVDSCGQLVGVMCEVACDVSRRFCRVTRFCDFSCSS
jgi:hypothetical protein